MTNQRVLDLLTDHAEALNRSDDVAGFDTAVWLAKRNSIDSHSILPLMQLAQKVKLVLVPTRPSHLFRDKLRQDLTQNTLTEMAGRSIGRFIWLFAAIIISLVGIVLLVLRWLKFLPSQSNEGDVVTTAV